MTSSSRGASGGAREVESVGLEHAVHTARRMLDVVCLSHLRWGFVYQRPNHLMSRCARHRRVFFVEEPVFEGDEPALSTREACPNLTVVVPRLPAKGSPREIAAAHRSLLDGLFERFGIERPLLWFYTPMALAYAGHVEAAGVVFDCMDELSAFHGAPPNMRQYEQELFDRASVVFTGGHSLYEAKAGRHPNVHVFPSSVDAEHFARARRGDVPDPPDQGPIGRPRIGYFGVIDERMDHELVARVARARPGWQIVLVGPVVKVDPARLPRAANIHYLGQKAYEDLPAYIGGWDVAFMPFARNDATRFISPTKTLEYLAAGRPVVSTPIRDVVRPYGEAGIVRIAEPASFVAAIDEALAEAGTPAAAARRAIGDGVVMQTSWDQTWRRMLALVEAAVDTGRKVA